MISDLLIWIICLIISNFIWYLITNVHVIGLFFSILRYGSLIFVLNGFMSKVTLLILMITIGVLIIVLALLFTFPLVAIYYGITKAARNNYKYRAKYDVITGMEYYREQFKNIAPIDISLLSDLKIERDKDLTATLLSLENKKCIKIQDNKINMMSDNAINLLPSEKYLLNIIKTGNIDSKSLDNWEKESISETIKQGLIISNKDKRRFYKKLSLFFILFIMCVFVFSKSQELMAGFETKSEQLLKPLEVYENIDMEQLSEKEQLILIQEFFEMEEVQQHVILLVKMIFVIICTFMVLIIPFFSVAYLITFKVSKPSYKRTNKGKILTEKLAGMKNFIHDFSNLKEADKVHLALWDDFLVYAVVLEENEKIIKEISQIRKIDLSRFKIS